MVLLTGPTQIAVAAPAATNSAAYQSELSDIKAAQASLTDAQKANIDYWSAGGALRWNEILREAVTASDLPPAPNPDGSYPSPDPTNPFADPRFPFSNPPYASRAYSYVSAAQYDALKVAWYYKFLYNRQSPFMNDNGIKDLMPNSNVPSYPSEDAVEAGVNLALLTLLFPTSAVEITQKAQDQQQAAMQSGRATASDIAAGLQIGQAVAALFKARAGTDGLKAASGNAAIWQGLVTTTAARGETPWISQDIPPRPPMLPLFNNVKGWMMQPADFLSIRPGPPPSTSSQQFQQETVEVKNAVANITDAQRATVFKWADGVSTPTPSGHWNAIAVPYITAAKFSEVRTASAFALLNMSLMNAAISCWDAKYYYFNPRPTQTDPSIKTEIPIPNFPSYVSGHSVFSGAAADVLSYLFPSGATDFNAQMQEAALSRLYGGIHYRSDITVGVALGKSVGDFTVTFAKSDGAD
jgi:membrane-associated phospholipid phosphatase